MPPIGTDGRPSPDPTQYGNVSTFTAVTDGQGVMSYGDAEVRFPLQPFMGMMGSPTLRTPIPLRHQPIRSPDPRWR